jgi:hypothetical protein
MKKLTLFRRSTPEKSGYPDLYILTDAQTTQEIARGACGTNPNPIRPSNHAPWQNAYGQIAAGTYSFECMVTGKHGKCLAINGGGKVPTTNSNVNHNGAKYAEAVLVHEGFSATWRGSAACCTIPPTDWKPFIARFAIGEKGDVVVGEDANKK